MKNFEQRVSAFRFDAGNLYVLPTSARDIVTFRGSFRSCPDLTSKEDLVQSLCVSTLDKGTKHRSKVEIAETLENLGAELSFSSEDLRVAFSGRLLRKDLSTVIHLLAEQLRVPALSEEEFDLVRVRSIAAARRSMESTARQADRSLRRALFDHSHPNFGISPEETIAFYESARCDTARRFHEDHFGSRELNIVFVGDVDPQAVGEHVEGAFADWPDHGTSDRFSSAARSERVSPESFVEIADRPNTDVALGHGLSLRRNDPDFIPLYVGNYILGGNFSARLMQKIRDELGLTYGIRSALSDVAVEYDGLWQVSVTLSGDNVTLGTEQTLAEVRRFVEEGATADELESKQETITGSYAVGLATTGGLAQSLLTNLERGFGPAYLDRFPEEVAAVTLSDVNAAVQRHLDLSRLHVATAGSTRPGT